MATSGNLVSGKVADLGNNDGGGWSVLRTRLVALVAILGCAGALAFGGLRAADTAATPAAMGSPAGQVCVAASVVGVPGEGCAAASYEFAQAGGVAPMGCVYADVRGVPGEGCTPER